LGCLTFQSSDQSRSDNTRRRKASMTKMTTSERAEKIKFHIEFMILMLGCGRDEKAEEHVKKALDLLQDLIDSEEE
jgi:hypothetical protein